MTDVQSQMEANGLPTKFESNADKPAEDRGAANVIATTSNAEIKPVADLKQPAQLESPTLMEPASSEEPSVIPESSPLENGGEAKLNGNLDPEARTTAVKVNGHGASQHAPEPSQSQPVDALATQTSINESVVPSSMPSENLSATFNTELSQTTVPSSLEPATFPEQAPTSDLRTVPHSDRLAPETIAVIEERKHTEDSEADQASAPVSALANPPALGSSSDTSTVNKIGLPSPPAQSPPPAPEMPHATLPTMKSVAPAAEVVPASVPTETPVEPVPTPVVPPVEEAAHTEDAVMEEAPAPPSGDDLSSDPITADMFSAPKLTREREDDMETDEPSAKRVRTDEGPSPQQSEFKIPEPPTPSAQTELNAAPLIEGDDAITLPRLAHMKKVISNLKKSNASQAFRLPVDYQALNIPTYPEVVKQPMDLGTIDSRLKKNEYTSVKDFVTDFGLIVNNCVLFNGREHAVTQSAFKMQSSFNNQMQQMPKTTEMEPSKAEKKAMKLKTEPIRAAPPRRQSVTTPASAKTPKSTAPPTPSFAPGPDGVPLIRRDSSIVDGRPKRAIVPPKRNSDFSGVRPKKKKYELQLRFCQEVLKEISSTKHWQINQYFTHPVDPVALNIPTYFQVIKKPMDLGTVTEKLNNNQYEKAKDFEEDVRLIFRNCYKFNPEGDYVNQMGHQLEELFDRKWAQKDDWIAAREPHSEPSEAEEEEEEEASEEEDDSEDDRNEKIKALQAQIEAMSKQMGELTQTKPKKKSTPPAPKSKKTKAKKEKAPAQFPGLSKSKDPSKKSGKRKAEKKERYVTFQEKQYISNGIGMLPENKMQEALRIIQSSVPALANNADGEIELDIEDVPNTALLQLLSFVRKYAPLPPEEQEVRQETFSAAPTKSKKNKPMSKQEQEAQIQELKGKLGAYADPVSPGTMQSPGTGNDSSEDSADSEESEEE